MAEIIKTEEGVTATNPKTRTWSTGALLTMSDGTKWLHPYNGGKPFQVAE